MRSGDTVGKQFCRRGPRQVLRWDCGARLRILRRGCCLATHRHGARSHRVVAAPQASLTRRHVRGASVPVKIQDLRGHVIVSCQPVKDGPLDRAEFVVGLALAALEGGAAGIRIESPRNVQAVRAATGAPIIGLVKRRILSSPVIITPEISDVQELAGCGADIVAFDATLRARPVPITEIISAIHAHGRFAMADVATYDDARAAIDAGVDMVGTTLSGYSGGPAPPEPDLDLVSRCAGLGVPVLAEGRYRTPNQARLAIEAGAYAVGRGIRDHPAGAHHHVVRRGDEKREANATVSPASLGGRHRRHQDARCIGRRRSDP